MKMKMILLMLFLFSTLKSQIIISELQSSNASTITDNAGEYIDWIEIKNTSALTIDVAGMVLKDNVDTWRIPTGDAATLLEPGACFLLWADDETTEGKFHTNFKLSAANGEFLGLYQSDSSTVSDSVTFPQLSDDVSYGKCAPGSPWKIFTIPTPLTDNDCISANHPYFNNNDITVYPTVVLDKIQVNLSATAGKNFEISIFAFDGKLLYVSPINESNFSLDLGRYKDGLYIINIKSDRFSFSNKVMVRN
jgi:hypothetical protein